CYPYDFRPAVSGALPLPCAGGCHPYEASAGGVGRCDRLHDRSGGFLLRSTTFVCHPLRRGVRFTGGGTCPLLLYVYDPTSNRHGLGYSSSLSRPVRGICCTTL